MEKKWTYPLWGAVGGAVAPTIIGLSPGMPDITPETIIVFFLGMSGVGMLCVASFDKARELLGIAEENDGRCGAGSETAAICSPEQGSSTPAGLAPAELKVAA